MEFSIPLTASIKELIVKSRAEKKKVIDQLSQSFSELTSLVMVDYQGLKSGEMDELRKSLRDNNVEFYVVKNSLM
jgi:large subunit ribosomal protein L10